MKLNILKILPFFLVFSNVSASQPVPTDAIGVEIVADDGSVFARYDLAGSVRDGSLRAYLEARRGSNYGIRVHNHSGGRIGLVIAVDGRNIISGQKSELGAGEPMYVLGAHQQAIYQGWRTSDVNVQRFYFTEVEDSYADAWGDRSAMGVIAVAAFRERPRVELTRRSQARKSAPLAEAPAAGRAAESAADTAAGTGFGESRHSRSRRVHFEPYRQAFARQFLKYEWRETLVRLGIVREAPPANRFWPEQLGQAQGFAPHPPGYWSRRR